MSTELSNEYFMVKMIIGDQYHSKCIPRKQYDELKTQGFSRDKIANYLREQIKNKQTIKNA